MGFWKRCIRMPYLLNFNSEIYDVLLNFLSRYIMLKELSENTLPTDKKVILELKASEKLSKADELQLINYLKATDLEVGLLLNFGKQPQFRRKKFSNK